MSLIDYIHGGVDLVLTTIIQVIGLRVMLGLRTGSAIALSLLCNAFTIPFLAIFAR